MDKIASMIMNRRKKNSISIVKVANINTTENSIKVQKNMFTDKTANMITIKKKNPTTAITIKDTTIKGIITRRIITKGIMKKDTIILMKA